VVPLQIGSVDDGHRRDAGLGGDVVGLADVAARRPTRVDDRPVDLGTSQTTATVNDARGRGFQRMRLVVRGFICRGQMMDVVEDQVVTAESSSDVGPAWPVAQSDGRARLTGVR
jgi:hypothetical protein